MAVGEVHPDDNAALAEGDLPSKVRFELISPDDIVANPQNPRQEFDEEKLDELAASISEKGVLVPITVYERTSSKYVLLDGERRWRAAKRINLSQIPAWVTTHPDKIKNIEAMFHIHMEREDWNHVDTLKALRSLIKASGVTDPTRLQSMTGLPSAQVSLYQRILAQPNEYQELIIDGTLPINFFNELHQRIIEPLKSQRPGLFKKFNEAKITERFVKRRKEGALENMTQLFRQVHAVIRKAGESGAKQPSEFDKQLEQIFTDTQYPIEEAYEDATGATVEIQKFARHCDRFIIRLRSITKSTLSKQDNRTVRRNLKPLLREVRAALTSLRAK